jgi:hypothetical protein
MRRWRNWACWTRTRWNENREAGEDQLLRMLREMNYYRIKYVKVQSKLEFDENGYYWED